MTMIQIEYPEEGRVRYYSDTGMMIRQIETGVLYEDAAHNIPCIFTYEETDIPIPADDTDIEDSEALQIITGVEQ